MVKSDPLVARNVRGRIIVHKRTYPHKIYIVQLCTSKNQYISLGWCVLSPSLLFRLSLQRH